MNALDVAVCFVAAVLALRKLATWYSYQQRRKAATKRWL